MIGPFEEAILTVLIKANGEATTVDVYDALVGKLRRVSLGAIYTTLDRMREKKFIERRKGEPLPERGGKSRYYYKITNAGRAAVIDSRQIIAAIGVAVPAY
jgi:PadR family transcriptional regulator, regulatory protein PadR